MPKEKKSKKQARRYRANGVDLTQVWDFEKLTTAYSAWKTKCGGLSGAELGMTGSSSLLDLVKKHGDTSVARPYTDNPLDEGANTIIDTLDKLISDSGVVLVEDRKNILDVKKKLEDLQDTDADPSNILFTNPDMDAVDPGSADYDEDDEVVKVRGHYRTEGYVEYRDLKAKLFENVNKETIKAVDKSWYAEGDSKDAPKNQAKPPMWQALFSNKKNKGNLNMTGLLGILEIAKEVTDPGKIINEHTKLEAKDIAKGGLADEIWEHLPDVKKWIEERIGTKDNIGDGINPNTGNFKDDAITRALSNFPFVADTLAERKEARMVLGLDRKTLGDKTPIGKMKNYSLILNRGMVKNLAMKTGLCARRSRKGPVYLKGYEPPSKKGVKKSWREMLNVV